MSHEVAQAASKSTQESCTSDPSASLSAKDDPFSGKTECLFTVFLHLYSYSHQFLGLMKDADKLKLMLLAWNYQNSNVAGEKNSG